MTDLHAEQIGVGAMMLGAGRDRAEDAVDHAVGVVIRARVGERVAAGDAILEVHYRDEATLAAALPLFRRPIAVGDSHHGRRVDPGSLPLAATRRRRPRRGHTGACRPSRQGRADALRWPSRRRVPRGPFNSRPIQV